MALTRSHVGLASPPCMPLGFLQASMSGTLNGPSHPTCRQRSNSCQSVAASSASYLFSCRRRCVVTTGQHNLWQLRYLSALRSLATLAKAPTLHPRSFTDCLSSRIRTALLVGGRPHLLMLLQLRLVPVAAYRHVGTLCRQQGSDSRSHASPLEESCDAALRPLPTLTCA